MVSTRIQFAFLESEVTMTFIGTAFVMINAWSAVEEPSSGPAVVEYIDPDRVTFLDKLRGKLYTLLI